MTIKILVIELYVVLLGSVNDIKFKTLALKRSQKKPGQAGIYQRAQFQGMTRSGWRRGRPSNRIHRLDICQLCSA